MKLTSQIPTCRIFFMSMLTFFLLLCFYGKTIGQSNCPNSNFSLGSFSGWNGYYGYFNTPAQYSGLLINDRHTIIPQAPPLIDPHTCNGLHEYLPGESFIAKLGNDAVTGSNPGWAEQLSYTINVTDQTNLFIYKYAVVLQDPANPHAPDERPSFSIDLHDATGQPFIDSCAHYYIYSQPTIPGWNICNMGSDQYYVWKDWTTVGLDLSPYIGQQVAVVFTTKDCLLGGHFGYAYLSTSCSKLEMTVSYCPESTSATLTAPPGFFYSWITGETIQSIVITNPAEGSVYSCVLTAMNGCQVTINATIQPTIITPNFTFTPKCNGIAVPFLDACLINQNSITNWKWEFGDATPVVIGVQNPSHLFANCGTYNVKLIAYSSDGCSDTIIKPVVVYCSPTPSLSGPDTECQGTTGVTYSTESGFNSYSWSIAGGSITDGGTSTSEFAVVTWNLSGMQSICVNYVNSSGCGATPQKCKNVLVNPTPIPLINGPDPRCVGSSNNVYTTQSGMSNYDWTISSGGHKTSGGDNISNTVTITWDIPGNQNVKVGYTSSEGCPSNGQSVKNITVHLLPIPVITGPDTACVNSTGKVFSTAAGKAPYTWTHSGASVVTGGNPTDNSITLTWNSTGVKTVGVNYTENGCTANAPTIHNITVNPRPSPTITGNLNPPFGSTNTYTTQQGMFNYFWTVTGGTIIGSTNGNSVNITWTSSGNQYITVNYSNSFGCFGASPDTLLVVVHPYPIVYNVIGGGPFCEADSGVYIGLENSEVGVYYQLKWNGTSVGDTIHGTGSSFNFPIVNQPGIYTVFAANIITGLSKWMSGQAVVTQNPLPTVFLLTPPGDTCAGTNLCLNGSQQGVSYTLYYNISDSLFSIMGTGQPGYLCFGPQIIPGSYRCIAEDTATHCRTWMDGIVTLHPNPTIFNVIPSGILCEGDSIRLGGSQSGVIYQLIRDNVNIVMTLNGTGDTISFGSLVLPGYYTVIAIDTVTLCNSFMNGGGNLYSKPTAYAITPQPSGHYCPPVDLGLNDSDTGVTYKLIWNDVDTVSSVSGTGSVFVFIPAQTRYGYYRVWARNDYTHCDRWMMDTIWVDSIPLVYNLTPSGPLCLGDTTLHLDGSKPGVQYQLVNTTTNQVDTIINGTGNPIYFGRTKSIGTYKILAVDMIHPPTYCSSWMNGSAIISPIPDQYLISPSGIQCAGTVIQLLGSQSVASYTIFRINGIIITEGTTQPGGGVLNFGPQTVPGTYKIRGTFLSSPNCFRWMEDSTVIIALPDQFNVSASGTCAPVRLCLSGSQQGMRYQLIQNPNTSNEILQETITGTGVQICFDSIRIAGIFGVRAGYQGSPSCPVWMIGMIVIRATPHIYAIAPHGVYCAGEVVVQLTGSQDASYHYILTLNGADWDTLNGVNGPLSFGIQGSAGVYRIRVDTANLHCGVFMNDSVILNPKPNLYSLSPADSICPGTYPLLLNTSQSGVNYLLINRTTGLTMKVVKGTGNSIDFGLQYIPGIYRVKAIDTTKTTNCWRWMNDSTTIKPLPSVFTVYPGGVQCAGTEITLLGSQSTAYYELWRRNGPFPTLVNNLPGSANGGLINFGPQTVSGVYTIKAIYNVYPHCDTLMDDSVTIIALPTAYNIAISHPPCIPATINLPNSQVGVNYQLVMLTPVFTYFPTIVSGGGPISFGPLYNAGTYTVVAAYPTLPFCMRWMNDTVELNATPTIFAIFPHGDTCSGAEVRLNGSVSGIDYTLMLNHTTIVKTLPGADGELNFGHQYSPGTYTIRTDTAHCSVFMADSLVIHARPMAYNLIPAGPNCDSTEVKIFHSDIGIQYELRKYGLPIDTLPGINAERSFGYQHGGVYSVRGFDPVTGCDSLMNGVVTITALPGVNVGPDTSMCPGYSINLQAQAGSFNPATVIWSANGPGTFSPPNLLATIFTPVQTSGTITLTATVHGVSPECSPQKASDSLVLTIVPFPQVNTGADTTICASVTSLPLNAIALGYHTFNWVSSSGGTFNPPTAGNTTYTINNTDRNNGSVTLTLSASGLLLCPDHITIDERIITIDSLPKAFAGNDTTICASDSIHLFNSTSSHALNPLWTILPGFGNGPFLPNPPNVLHPTYYPTNADKIRGYVKLILTVIGTSSCSLAQHSDTIRININPMPLVDAGANTSICIADTFQCNPQVQHISNVSWQGGDGTFIPNNQTLLARYHPGTTDSIAGCVTLKITVGGTMTCNSQTAIDSLLLCFDARPGVDAGPADTICSGDSVHLTGDTINSSGVYWLSTKGSLGGYFSPNNTVINPFYHPSLLENSLGKAVLVIKAFGRLGCSNKTPTDTVVISIRSLPTAVLTGGTTLCEGETDTVSVSLTGSPPWNITYLAGITPHVISGIYASPFKFSVTPTVTTTYTMMGVSDKYCTGKTFSGNAIFNVHPKPLSFAMLTPMGTNFCQGDQGVIIKLISSQTSIKYELKLFNTTVGMQMGNNGTMLNFGYQTIPGIYKVWASQGWPSGDTCHNWMQDSVIVTVTQPPMVNFFIDPSCLGDSTHFHLSGGTEILRVGTWTWSFGVGPPVTYNYPYEPSHLYPNYGNYLVTLTVMDTSGVCTKVLMQQIAVAPLPIVSFYFDPYSPNCQNQYIHFYDASTNVGNNSNVTWVWNFGDGSPSITINWPNSPDTLHLYPGPGTYSVILNVTNNHGCTNSDTIQVTVHPTPVPNFYSIPLPACANELVHFFDQSQINGSGNIISYAWNFNDLISGTGNTSNLINPVHTYIQSGTYDSVRLVITASNGCKDTIYKTIVVQQQPEASFTATTVCQNEITQFTSTSVANANSITNYKWYFGDGNHLFGPYPTASHIYLSAGQYQVSLKITNSNGCSDSVSLFVNVRALPFAAFTHSSGNCVGDSVSFVNASTTQQSYICKWTWNFGDLSQPVTISLPFNPDIRHKYTNPGTYNVTLTVQTGDSCVDSQTNQVVIVDNPVANFSWSIVHCERSPIQFTDLSQPVGLVPISTWNWNFGDPQSGVNNGSAGQNPSHIFNVPGSYSVQLIVNNINGCDDTITHTVHIDSLPNASFHADTVCKGTSTVFTDISIANSGTISSWLWNFGDGTPPLFISAPAQGDTSHLFTNPGTYTVILLVTNSLGCQKDTSIQVIVNPHPSALFSHSGSACKWASIQFTDMSYTPSGVINQWDWDFGDGTPHSNVKNPAHSYNSAGVFMVKLKVWNTFSCTDSIAIPITIQMPPTAHFSYANTFCYPGVVSFHDSSTAINQSIVAWLWTFEPGQTSTLQNPSFVYPVSNTILSYLVCLVVTDGNGCRDTICDSVSVKPGMTMSIQADTVCFKNPTHLHAVPAMGDYLKNFLWNFNDPASPSNTSTLSDPTHTFTSMGLFTVTLSALNSDNCQLSSFKIVSVDSLPTPDFTYDPIPYCDTAKVIFRYKPAGIGQKVDSVRWRFGQGIADITQYTPLSGIMKKHLGFGTYNVTMTAFNSNGCHDSISKQVSVTCLAASFGTDTLYCTHQYIHFYDSSAPSVAIRSWHWSFGDGTDTSYTIRCQPVQHIYQDTGTYQVNLIIYTIAGADTIYDSIKKQVAVKPSSVADFSISKTCLPDSTSFNIFTDTTDLYITSYSWVFGDNNAFGKDTSSLFHPKYRFKHKGNYTSALTVKNTDRCSYTKKHKFYVFTPPTAAFRIPDLICETDFFQLLDSSSYGDAKKMKAWDWNFDNSVTFDVRDPIFKYQKSGTYSVSLIVIDTAGCHDDTIRSINVNPSPVSSFTVTNGYNGKPGQIKLNNLTLGNNTYNWEFGNGKSDTVKNPVATYTEDGTYIIKLISLNQFVCSDTTFYEYKLLFKGLYVPNAFAPSSTNLGIRLFQPIGINIKKGEYHVTVFDIWGHLMWESSAVDDKGIPTEGWDGTFEGNLMPQGNYMWKISATFVDESPWNGSDNGVGDSKKTMGTVTLIR